MISRFDSKKIFKQIPGGWNCVFFALKKDVGLRVNMKAISVK